MLQFVPGVRQRQALVQIMQGDVFGAPRNLHHGRQGAAHQEKAAAHRHQAEQGHPDQKRRRKCDKIVSIGAIGPPLSMRNRWPSLD